jgi:lipopolysaccharide export system protein LptA
MEYENSKCTVTADSVVLEANGKTITGDQIIFNKNRGKAIVIKDNLIEVVDFRL